MTLRFLARNMSQLIVNDTIHDTLAMNVINQI